MRKNMVDALVVKTKEVIFEFGKEYISLVEKYEELKQDENYSEIYKEKKKSDILEKVRAGRIKAYEKALALVEKERKSSEKVDYKTLSIEEKTLIALEKNNLITMAKIKVEGASVSELREILEEGNFDEDIKFIIQAELKKRAKEKNGLDFDEKTLSRELRNNIDEFSNIEKQLKQQMQDEDTIFISYANYKSVKKDFDILDDKINNNYFSMETNRITGSLPRLRSGSGEVIETNYFK
ncbi:hypothetical protein P5F69_14560 [Clostridium perfringens]|nr:hypothetical protein [Clostridium perfringens]